MERYTEKHYDGNGYYLICSGNCETLNCGDCGILDKIVDRLAAYENTGLEPEEIFSAVDMAKIACALHELNAYKELGSIDCLRKLAQADREGRCVVLPAKPDQTIYQWRIGDDCPSVSRLDGAQINADGEITYPIWNGYLIPEDFGKTVFLTREEAALRREQDGE